MVESPPERASALPAGYSKSESLRYPPKHFALMPRAEASIKMRFGLEIISFPYLVIRHDACIRNIFVLAEDYKEVIFIPGIE